MAISTSSQTMDAHGLLTRIKKRSSAFLKLKPTQPCWPDAEHSTGSFYDTVDGENYWNLKNQKCSAFLKFSQLSKTLASILRKHTEAPTFPALWKAYMIGESAPLCALGILFCCGDTEYLKTAASHISASGAVDESSGVIVRYRSTLPRYKGKLIHLGLGRQEVDLFPGRPGPRDGGSASWPMEPHVYHTFSAGNRSTEHSHSSTLKALGYSPQCFTASEDVLPGDAVYVEMADGIQTATIGGRIKCGDQELFITAAHPFTDRRPGAKEKSANGKEGLPTRLKDAGCLYYSSCFNERPELDYALIQPRGEISMIGGPLSQSSDSIFAFPVFTSEEDFRNLVETTVQTSSASAGMIVGELDTIPEFLEIPGATKLQEVYAAHFESVLAPGDSGSWVYNAEGDILHGHIVAGVPEDGLALIVPAHLVFADLMETFASMAVQSSREAFVSQGPEKSRSTYTPATLTDQIPPCNTLHVGNLPMDTSEDELKAVFSSQRGYKRLCFRTKQNGPMCFVEFEDTSLATEALDELDGYMLHHSNKSGIRLSFSKNPLGVRKTQQFQAESVDVNRRKDLEIELSQKDLKTQAALKSYDSNLSTMGTSVTSSPESTSQGFESNVQHPSHEISHPGNYDSSGRLAFQYLSDAETPLDAATDETLENMMEGLSTWPVFESREQPDGIASQYVDPARLRATDTTHWGIMEAAWPNFESREQPDGIASQYVDPARLRATDTTHWGIMEAAWPNFESREQPDGVAYQDPAASQLDTAADTTHLSMMEAAWPDFESREEQSYETPFHYRLGRAETSLDAATDASFNRQDNLLV
jgi:hypothetical protein